MGSIARFGAWLLSGAIGALAFPLVIPSFGTRPCLDFMPREVALVPLACCLFWAVNRDAVPLKERGKVCVYVGLGYFGMLLHWLDVPMVRFGGLPQAVALPLLVALVALCSCFWGALPWVYVLLRRHASLPEAISFASAFVCLDWLRGACTSFPWGAWGYSQARNLPWVQLASLAGVQGVGWLLAYLGALMALAYARRNMLYLYRAGAWGAAATVLGLVLQPAPDDPRAAVSVGIVQPSIAQDLKNAGREHREAIKNTLYSLSGAARNAGAELIVWPEGAIPDFVPMPTSKLPIHALGTPLLMGVAAYSAHRPPHLYNASAWLDADGIVQGMHAKRHLVPFGEYVPLHSLLPVNRLVPGAMDATPGDSDTPLGDPPVGVLICYDGVFGEPTRATVRQGATFLANLTNDAWYGISSGPYQHLDFYVFRAAESRRWVARAANSGISAFIDPAGRISRQSALGTPTILLHNIYRRQELTLYMHCGDWLLAACLGCIGGAVAVCVAGRLDKRKTAGAVQNGER